MLCKLLSGNEPRLAQWRQQLDGCAVVSRTFSGVGFFTDISVSVNHPRIPGLHFHLGDVIGIHPQLRHGAGFVLFVRDGVLNMIEGYTYDEPWPAAQNDFILGYVTGAERDWEALHTIWQEGCHGA